MDFYNYYRSLRRLGKMISIVAMPLVLAGIALFFAAKSAVFSITHPTRDLVEVKSPDGRYFARSYHIFAKGKDPAFTYVVIYPNDFDLFYKPDNLLVVEKIEPVKVEWKGRQQLVVESPSADADEKTSVWRDVKVDYVDLVGH
jgi:hypothetical protein